MTSRDPKRLVRVALGLWMAWAVVIWNVVFDYEIVMAGRAYLHASAVAAQSGSPYVRIDTWMRPALATGFWTASAAAAAVLAVGVVGIRMAIVRSR